MRIVKKIPKSAVCFDEKENDEISLYATRKCAYLIFKNVGKFVNGEYVRIRNKKMIYRFTPEEFKEFTNAVFNFLRLVDLIEGKYMNKYVI